MRRRSLAHRYVAPSACHVGGVRCVKSTIGEGHNEETRLVRVAHAVAAVLGGMCDFKGIEKFGLHAIKPRDFLKEIGEI